MKVAELLERRRENWQELERLCDEMKSRRRKNLGAAAVTRFATLYRAACADLALADAYQLPPNTVQYLHRLVARAHNQLHRSRLFDFGSWGRMLLVDTPQRIFNDRCIQAVFCMFWGVFILSAMLAYSKAAWPDFADKILGVEFIEQLESNFETSLGNRPAGDNFQMACFYIRHNTGIGLKCFVSGVFVVPGLFITMFNAAYLGAAFGYMARPESYASGQAGENFFHFVTAHGPFELTAIALSAGAGLRIGLSWIVTRGLSRADSLVKAAEEAMPHMGAAAVMFAMAALIEGFISPAAFIPYAIKAGIAVVSSLLLMFYFVVLGFPRRAIFGIR